MGKDADLRRLPGEAKRHFQAAEDDFGRAKKLLDSRPDGSNPDARYVLLVNWGTVKTLERQYHTAIKYLSEAARQLCASLEARPKI